jgi:glucokinase
MPRPADTYSLVADIGGTNTRVALALGPELLPETIRRYRNADYPGLESVLRAFIAEEDGSTARAPASRWRGRCTTGRPR